MAMTQALRVAGFLLDMDGTLIDSEVVFYASALAAMSALGYADAEEISQAMLGVSSVERNGMLRSRCGSDFPMAAFDQARLRHRDALLEDGLRLKKGAIELLDAIDAADRPKAIATSSSRRTAEKHLTLAGIRDRFDVIITREDVQRGKPAPDLFLMAARHIELSPSACIAIEDSNPGILAAHASGAFPIMVPDVLPPNPATRGLGVTVLPDLLAVLTFLRECGALP
jgi:HAD superfamily hydrolase (TIGR01509 family)